MPLTLNEHYTASAACFIGGTLSVVTQLWLLFDFLPMLRVSKGLKSLHQHLTLANLFVVLFFFMGAISHFEQRWIFGDTMCKFYVFWCKFTPVASMTLLALCLYGEYQHALDPSLEKKNVSYTIPLCMAWAYGLLWGSLALTTSEYGQEPAGFTCTVIWYKVQSFTNYLTILGFGTPSLLAFYYSFNLWHKGFLIDNPMAQAAVGLMISMTAQFSVYAGCYMMVLAGHHLSLYAIAFPQIWTKSVGVVHPFIYSHVFASDSTNEKEE